MDPEETGPHTIIDESPPVYEVTRPRYFGMTPHVLAGVLAATCGGAGVALLATGNVAVGLLLVVAALLLGALFTEQARRTRATKVDKLAAGTVDQSRALVGYAGASVKAWTSAGRRAAKLRLDARTLQHERAQLQDALGAAAYENDERKMDDLRGRMKDLDERIKACETDARAALAGARTRTERERRAVASTQIRRPG